MAGWQISALSYLYIWPNPNYPAIRSIILGLLTGSSGCKALLLAMCMWLGVLCHDVLCA